MGALSLALLLSRAGSPRSLVPTQVPPSPESLNVQTIPVPHPPTHAVDSFQDRLERDLTKQQDLTESLQQELQAQKELADDLKMQLERQRAETDMVVEQLRTYQQAVEDMTSQQVRLIESIPRNNETQTMILWGILGLFMMLMLGGGTAFAIIALWLMHLQRQTHRPPPMYPVRMPPHPYLYYDNPPLPSPTRRQQLLQYGVRPFEE
ncbi:MAG: OmpH family outer membrane protein [Leptolyngbya sp. LCM1.Bin17]|nr:MAG: OmpH family outer membrane protein [Leptolyngbya sp. LCM1.Bin17]